MAKIKVKGFENLEFEPGQSREAKDYLVWAKEQGLGDNALLESAEGRRLKGERADIVDHAYNRNKPEEKKVEEKKVSEPNLFESAKKELDVLKKKIEGYIKDPSVLKDLNETEAELDRLSRGVLLRESDPDDESEIRLRESLALADQEDWREAKTCEDRLRQLHR